MTIPAGTAFGPYEVVCLIGAGGMGEVYRAHDPRIGRDVALKVLAARAADPDELRRFEQEARAIGQLNHPNILTIHDAGRLPSDGVVADAPFIVTELLEGHTLRHRLAQGRMDPTEAIVDALQVARGLAAAHERGIVHRDLKPENLFVLPDGRLKILDFGIAKLAATATATDVTVAYADVTRAGVMVGTPGYMSPEQLRGERVGPQSDVFAFGVILYEMLAGARPFAGDKGADRIGATLRDDPAPLAGRAPGVPQGLEGIVRRCLEKRPEDRFPSARDLVVALEAVAASQAGASSPPPAAAGQRTAVFAAAGAVLLLLASVGAWLVGREPDAPSTTAHSTPAPRVTPFLASDAIEDDPAWSPAGNLIAYVSDATGNADIWICDPSGSNPINLTAQHTGVDSVPAWSPDGTRIAFFSEREGGGIFTMNALGGDVRKAISIKPGVVYTVSLTWARDGSLVYTNFSAEGRKHVYRGGASGEPPACLTCDAGTSEGGRSGQLSADGTLLLYKSSEMGARGSTFVRHLASGAVHTVLDRADMPRWAADGRHIIFISARDGTPDLWQVGIDPQSGARTGEPERVTSGLGITAFALAPDGRQILAVTEKSHANLWSFPANADRIDSLAQGEQWTTGQFMDTRGRWLTDNAGVIFQSNRRGSLDIWTVGAPGAPPQRVTTDPGTEHRPRVSPDGQWIAFDAIDETGEHVRLMRRDGSGSRLLDPLLPRRFSMSCCADWSPDGRRLAIHVNNWTSAIVRLDPSTGAAETTPVDFAGGADEYHRWSPSGTRIAYEAITEGSWDLWTANPDGSQAQRLTSLPGNERTASWHPRLPFIYFDGEGAIWRVRTDPEGRALGLPERWLVLPGRTDAVGDGLDFSADRERVLITVRERASDIWLVELVSDAKASAAYRPTAVSR
jgi:Tol biopolymer transport system component